MFTTLELRWFSHGIPPTEVEHWFNEDCPGESLGLPEEREDLYLYTPECDDLNIKLRQGTLEVKWRKAELGILRFGEASNTVQSPVLWEGKVEKWLKWICEDPAKQSIVPADVLGKGPWIVAKKKRSQRRYHDISYELTQLTVKNNAWWSIAFEMVSNDANQLNSFQSVVNSVNKTYPGPELSADNSYAYPHWLSLVA